MKIITHISCAALLIAASFSANSSSLKLDLEQDNQQQALNTLKTTLTNMPVPLNVAHTRTESEVEDGERVITVARITPNSHPLWELTSYNGDSPSKKEIKKFKKKMKKQAEDEQDDPFISILNLESMKYFESTDEFEVFKFDPVISAFKEEAKYDLDGRVYVDKTGVIQKIRINAPASFKPVFGATMHTFLLEYKIAYNKNTAYIQDHKMLIDAKIGGFKNLHMDGSGTNSDIIW